MTRSASEHVPNDSPVTREARPTLMDLLDRAHANFIEIFRLAARISRRGAIEEEDGLVLTTTGSTLALFNPAFVTHTAADPAYVIQRARDFYARHDVPWMLRAIDDATAEALTPALEAQGFTPRPLQPGMLLAPLSGQIPAVPGLLIRVVRDAVMLRTYVDTLAAGFEAPRPLFDVLDNPRLLAAPDTALYLGLVDDMPVATALRVTSHRIAGIYNITTVPAHRRRGYGEALTWWATLDGVDEGCLGAYLQASDVGLPIYRRMGYRTIIQNQSWDAPVR